MSSRERIEAAGMHAVIFLLRRMSPVRASNLGSGLARLVGPFLSASRVAHRNLRLAMPETTERERARIVKGVWDNIGRTAAELPHLNRLGRSSQGPGWELVGEENLRLLKNNEGPALFFSGHFANWEIILPIVATIGVNVGVIYREASNPLADRIIQRLRHDAMGGRVPMFAKGAKGAREALAHLKRGGSVAMMMDQKMNDGIPTSFFGHKAMTATALASFALRFRCPVFPVHLVRLGPARYRLTLENPLYVPNSGDEAEDRAAVTLDVNRTLERWIRARPESWLWLHRRWPKAGESPGSASAAI